MRRDELLTARKQNPDPLQESTKKGVTGLGPECTLARDVWGVETLSEVTVPGSDLVLRESFRVDRDTGCR